MRWAKSYSIVDHAILHGGYLHRLSHESMVLYLFLVVVGDRDGRSFYADITIMDIVRLSERGLNSARQQLIKEGLIDYQRPYWWVRNIPCISEVAYREKGERDYGRTKAENTILKGCDETEFLSDRRASRDFAKACLKDISRMLQGG